MLQTIITLCIGIIGVGFVIGIHELGHFLCAKLFNIHTPSFSIGMGPRIFEKKIGDTTFALSAIPLGGYVEIAGMAEINQGDQKSAHSTDSTSFAVKPYWQKMLVISAGVIFNLVSAYITLFILAFVGLPERSTIISTINPDTAAAQADLLAGDTLVSIDDHNLNNSALELVTYMHNTRAGQTVCVQIMRNGLIKNVPVTLGARNPGSPDSPGALGITDFTVVYKKSSSFIQAHNAAYSIIRSIIFNTFTALSQIFRGGAIRGTLGGPLMLIKGTAGAASQGVLAFLFFLAFFSVSLAVLNILPIPILDGGQAVFITLEAILRRPLNPTVRQYIHIACWLLLMGLMLVLSYYDLSAMLR